LRANSRLDECTQRDHPEKLSSHPCSRRPSGSAIVRRQPPRGSVSSWQPRGVSLPNDTLVTAQSRAVKPVPQNIFPARIPAFRFEKALVPGRRQVAAPRYTGERARQGKRRGILFPTLPRVLTPYTAVHAQLGPDPRACLRSTFHSGRVTNR
jgi:hypothetical protein